MEVAQISKTILLSYFVGFFTACGFLMWKGRSRKVVYITLICHGEVRISFAGEAGLPEAQLWWGLDEAVVDSARTSGDCVDKTRKQV